MKRQHEVIVIDDETTILRFVSKILTAEGHNVRTATTGSEGSGLALDPGTDLVILDLNLPDADGLDIARMLRCHSNVPILMLTSKAEVASRISGLDAGADDYLPKPFNLQELCARVRSLLRRATMMTGEPPAPVSLTTMDGWGLDGSLRSLVSFEGQREHLTEREFMILNTLIRRPGSVIGRDELQRQVAGRQWQSNDRSLDVHMTHLRKKIRRVSGGANPIKTIRSRGFLIDLAAGGSLQAGYAGASAQRQQPADATGRV
jgi:DNA-binding response OmpR family regulator